MLHAPPISYPVIKNVSNTDYVDYLSKTESGIRNVYLRQARLSFKPNICRLRLKCDGTRAVTRFRLSAKRTSTCKSAGASVQSTNGSPGVRISGSNSGYLCSEVV